MSNLLDLYARVAIWQLHRGRWMFHRSDASFYARLLLTEWCNPDYAIFPYDANPNEGANQ